jgi:glycosyltransferase involved in cell wall biosynthesis
LRISVVTISFNQGKYLQECLDSVRNQNYPDYEHIVVDAGSSDESVELLREYDSPHLIWSSRPDKGPADGLNRGFAQAMGEIFYYLNADDSILPGAFHRAVELFREDPDLDVFYGDGVELSDSGERVRRLFSNRWGINQFIYGACNVVQQSTFFRGSAYRKTRGFNVENRINWDAELLLDMALAGCKIKYIPEQFGMFRVYDTSITGSGKSRQMGLQERRRMAERALGRRLTNLDTWIKRAYRVQKWFRNPQSTAVKAMTYWYSRPSF